jgi:hypothetical protein
MHLHRRWLAGLTILVALAAALTQQAVVVGQGEGLRLIADRVQVKKGEAPVVILLNNCDASEGTKGGLIPLDKLRPDNGDYVINGPADKAQMTPIKIGQGAAAGPVVLKLAGGYKEKDPAAFDPTTCVRIFNSQEQPALGRVAAGPTPDKPQLAYSYTLSADELGQLAKGDLTFYAEGLVFAVAARLQLWVGEQMRDEVVLYVAPFLLSPHTQEPLENMVVQLPGAVSERYVNDFRTLCKDASQRSPRAAKMVSKPIVSPDPWIEDELQWGYTRAPHGQVHVALHMFRKRPRLGGGFEDSPLADNVRALLGLGHGYVRAFDYVGYPDAPNYGGNLEVTAPTDKWPWGRVYYGSRLGKNTLEDPDEARGIHAEFQAFFKRQKRHPSDPGAIQEPIDLWTSWLDVGHVDEIVSFVPAKNKRGFVLLWASPDLGLELLNDLPPDVQNDPNYLGKSDNGERYYASTYGVQTVNELLSLGKNPAKPPINVSFLMPRWDLATYNRRVASKIRANLLVLKRELDLTDDDIKEVPVVFGNALGSKGPVKYWNALALSPGMVNLSSMGDVSMVPKPFIPVFEKHMSDTMTALGQTPQFIDDWLIYHKNRGEVHCGSNMRRQPFAQKWWEQPGKKSAP